MARVRIVRDASHEWKGVYLNGVLLDEGHDITDWTWERILRKLGHDVIDKPLTREQENALIDGGRYPQFEKDLK